MYQPVQQPSAVVAALAKSQFHLPFRIWRGHRGKLGHFVFTDFAASSRPSLSDQQMAMQLQPPATHRRISLHVAWSGHGNLDEHTGTFAADIYSKIHFCCYDKNMTNGTHTNKTWHHLTFRTCVQSKGGSRGSKSINKYPSPVVGCLCFVMSCALLQAPGLSARSSTNTLSQQAFGGRDKKSYMYYIVYISSHIMTPPQGSLCWDFPRYPFKLEFSSLAK